MRDPEDGKRLLVIDSMFHNNVLHVNYTRYHIRGATFTEDIHSSIKVSHLSVSTVQMKKHAVEYTWYTSADEVSEMEHLKTFWLHRAAK